MIASISLAALLTVMMMGKLYPRQTIIITAIVVLLVLAYPVITHVDLSSTCSCNL